MKIFGFVVALAVLLPLWSCGGDDEPGKGGDDGGKSSIVGVWKPVAASDNDVPSYYLYFTKDGSYFAYDPDFGYEEPMETGSYTLKGDKLIADIEGYLWVNTVVLSKDGKTMSLSSCYDDEDVVTVDYEKIGDSPDGSNGPDEQPDSQISISEPIITDVKAGSAVIKGTILGDNVEFTERGVCFATSPNPTISNNRKKVESDVVNVSLSNLFEGTIYYVRLYANIGGKVSYGREVSFTTLGTSTEKIVLTESTHTVAGYYDEDVVVRAKLPNGISRYGLCYGTSPKPKITDNHLPEERRQVEWTLPKLKRKTTYYVRAYHIDGTKIIYYDDSEIAIETLGVDMDMSAELKYEKRYQNGSRWCLANPDIHFYYKNMPQGTYKVLINVAETKLGYGYEGSFEFFIDQPTGEVSTGVLPIDWYTSNWGDTAQNFDVHVIGVGNSVHYVFKEVRTWKK